MSDPTISDVYLTIASRLSNLTPPIHIREHIAAKRNPEVGLELEVKRNTLGGIKFKAKDAAKLRTALRNAKDLGGVPAFAEGSRGDPKHWALSMSFAKTHGIGFRGIWRPRPSERPLSNFRLGGNEAKWMDGFSSKFGDSPILADFSSLHCAVAEDICGIHIDEQGFVMMGPDGAVMVGPDFLRHTLVELLWRTELEGKIPVSALDRFQFIIPSSPNDFSRLGLSFDALQTKTYKLTVMGSCTIIGGWECSGTMTFRGTHDIGSGRK
jgi:hypothetical protein